MSSSPARPVTLVSPSSAICWPPGTKSSVSRALRRRAEKVSSAGAEARRTTLDDLDGLREAARNADGVIHLAFKHDLALVSGDFMGP